MRIGYDVNAVGMSANYIVYKGGIPPCSGTPSPGNTLASENPVCPSVPFTLSLQNFSGTGATYQWQSSNDNTVWSNISGATNATCVTMQTVSTYYRCQVNCSGKTGISNTCIVTVNPLPKINLGKDTTICNNCSITLHAGKNFSSYLWQDGSTDSVYLVKIPGIYWVTVKNKSVCQSSDTIIISSNTKINLDIGLVACYPFNSNANDESGNGYNGIVNGATLTTDRLGNPNRAYEFDGIDDYIDISSIPISQTISFSLWIYVESYPSDEEDMIGMDGSYEFKFQSSLALSFWTKAGSFCSGGWPTQINSNSLILLNTWTYITITKDVNGEQKLYINGKLEADKVLSYQLIPICTYGKFFGVSHNVDNQFNWYYNGKLDDIRIYNRALNYDEIHALFTGNSNCKSCPSVNLGNDTTICNNCTITLHAGKNFSSYLWQDGSTDSIYIVNKPGKYWVTVKNSSGCQANDTIVIKSKSPINLDSGLVACYPFNGNANDESGNGNNGTVYGATLTTDRFGNPNSAYSFNGVSDYISLPSSIMIRKDMSISFWLETNETDNNSWPYSTSLIIRDLGGSVRDWSICFGNGGKIEFNTGGDSTGDHVLISNANVNNAKWNHIVIVKDAENYLKKIYINSILDNDINTVNDDKYTDFVNNNNSIGLGGVTPPSASLSYINGKMDDFCFYNRVLNQSEITTLYNGKSGCCGGCSPPIVNLGKDTAICSGNSLMLNAGNNGSTYIWNTGVTTQSITVTNSGKYIVTVSNANCSMIDSINVTVNPLPTATISGGGAVCAGGTLPNVSIILTGTPPWTLTYSNGVDQSPITETTITGINSNPYVISGAAEGTYKVIALSDANCADSSFSDSAMVTVYPLPTVDAGLPQTICRKTKCKPDSSFRKL